MDKLDEIFKMQAELDQLVGFSIMDYQEKINNNFMALIHEICEIHDETNWKHWKKTKKPEDVYKILEEFADIIHFVFQMALIYGFDSQLVFEAYVRKNQVNRERVKSNYWVYSYHQNEFALIAVQTLLLEHNGTTVNYEEIQINPPNINSGTKKILDLYVKSVMNYEDKILSNHLKKEFIKCVDGVVETLEKEVET